MNLLFSQKMKKPVSRITIGNLKEVIKPDAIKAALAEFISMTLYVFFAEGAVLFITKINKSPSQTHIDSLAISLTHGFSLFAAIAVGVNISGGHVSPAVTFGAFVGGHITFVRSILHCIAQCLGAIWAMYLLKFATGEIVNGWPTPLPLQAIIYEIVVVFFYVYAYYATIVDPTRGKMGSIGPIVIGLLCSVSAMIGGGIVGAAMNPAMAFSVAVITWTWTSHWVYWVGTFAGAAIAGFVYQTIFIGEDIYEKLPITNY